MHEVNYLENARRKQQLLRDRVTGLVKGLECGLLVYGPGGNGKSYIIDDELETCGRSHQKINSHITPMGLYNALKTHSDEIIVLEDCEGVLSNTISIGILRSATFPSAHDRKGNPIRNIDYYHGNAVESFQFNGGVILLMNRGLSNKPEAQALASRINCVEFAFSDAEVRALMRDLTSNGFTIGDQEVTAEECDEVISFLLNAAATAGKRLNLRMMQKALRDYLLADGLQAGLSWQDLVSSAINEQPSIVDKILQPTPRLQQYHKEIELIQSLSLLPKAERVAAWVAGTGKSPATYYRRIVELGESNKQSFSM